jgi:hypothetical protein
MSAGPPVEQEPDLVPGVRLFVIAVVALAIAGLGVLGAHWMLRSGQAHAAGVALPFRASLLPGAPEQTPIEGRARGLELQAEQRRRLESYGWVDRSTGVARIPIERAIELASERGH